MITIEEKLNFFTKLVYEKVEKENRDIIQRFEEEYGKILIEKKKEYEEEAKNFEERVKSEIELNRTQILSKAHIKGKRIILERKNAIYNKALEDVISYIKEIKGKKEYRQYFSNKLNNLIKINNIKEANLIVSRQDWELWGKEVDEGYKKVLKVEFEEKLDGGFILIDLNNNLKYDFSIENIIDESREKIGEKLFAML
ncbi:MAG: V-type ATP synthase subunit E family protein [Caloramator sp.]|nr:V-type ATP synthase subunit E family protein [Caloramator sp.]